MIFHDAGRLKASPAAPSRLVRDFCCFSAFPQNWPDFAVLLKQAKKLQFSSVARVSRISQEI